MRTLKDKKQYLIGLLLQGIPGSLRTFQQLVLGGSGPANELILLEARLNKVNQDRLQGTIKDEDLQLEYNRIRAGILQLINELDEEFLNPNYEKTQIAQEKKPPKNRGSILYHIPDVMEVSQEVKCTIRIAFDEDILVENFEVTVETSIEAIRIAEVMQVEMIDPAANPHFTIRTYSSKEQIVDVEAYTEWVFYVKPLQEGTYPLILKVAVIELVRKKERKREIVLEERVQILSAITEKELIPTAFKTADQGIRLGEIPTTTDEKEEEAIEMSKSMPSEGGGALPPAPTPPKKAKAIKQKKVSRSKSMGKGKGSSSRSPVFAEESSAPSTKRRFAITTVLPVVLLLIASSWFFFRGGKRLASPDKSGTAGEQEQNDSTFLEATEYILICGTDSLSVNETMQVILATDSYPTSQGNTASFYQYIEKLKKVCPSLEVPNADTHPSPQSIAQWYADRNKLGLLAEVAQLDMSIQPGAVVFGSTKKIELNKLSVQSLLATDMIDLVEVVGVEGLDFTEAVQWVAVGEPLLFHPVDRNTR